MRVPVLEFCYKNDDLGDPMVNNYHILAAGFATQEEIDKISSMALKVNELMLEFFKSIGVDLIDFKIDSARPPTARLSSQTRFPRIPAASGTSTPMKSSIRTVSAATWAVWKRLMPK